MSSKEYNTIVKTCWHTYAAPFAHELRPRRIVLLGKSLERAITMEELATQAAAMGATPLPTLSHPSDIKLAGKLVVNECGCCPCTHMSTLRWHPRPRLQVRDGPPHTASTRVRRRSRGRAVSADGGC